MYTYSEFVKEKKSVMDTFLFPFSDLFIVWAQFGRGPVDMSPPPLFYPWGTDFVLSSLLFENDLKFFDWPNLDVA